ncbi:MAG: HTH domain-containing protein [Anaerolineaceae bacterium]|nr:HTH domain-containing protein [Anaerolineaceae bacterium]
MTINFGSKSGGDNWIETLADVRQELRKRVRDLEKRRQDLEAELERAKKQLEHLDGFLNLEKGSAGRPPTVQSRSSSKQELGDLVEQVLRERKGEPMHYTELAKEVIRRGAVIRGKNPANGLVSRIHNDDRFVRPTRRGHYALKEDYPNSQSVGIRKNNLTIDYKDVHESGGDHE